MHTSSVHIERRHVPHRERSGRRRRKFMAIMAHGLRATKGVKLLGKDKTTRQLLEEHGLPAAELVVHKVVFGEQVVHVIGIPNKLWYCQETTAALRLVMQQMTAVGHRCLSIPQRAIEALGRTGPRPEVFFDLVLGRALREAPGHREVCCGNDTHDPTGCFAMRVSTGAGCHN